jgi:hypothetical protein
MTSEHVIKSWLAMLRSWQALATYSAIHITECQVCSVAEAVGSRGSYCSTGDRAWRELMEQERRVIGILPELRAAGIDVDKDCRESGFQFMVERETKH